MYITRVILKRSPSPDVIHGILSAAFPEKRNDRVNENLWRIDRLGDCESLIIVSASSPHIHEIVSKIGINSILRRVDERDDNSDKTIDYEPFLSRITFGQAWHFRLCANPVEHKKQSPTDKRGKIYALRTIGEQLEWLNKQGDKYGFVPGTCYVIGDSWITFDKVRIRAITFDGMLTVTDAEAFRSALTHGIGRGKAYGCGLLTVARSQT